MEVHSGKANKGRLTYFHMALGTCLKSWIFFSYQQMERCPWLCPASVCVVECFPPITLLLMHVCHGHFYFYLHFPSTDLHKAWITHDVLNLQFSMTAYWRLKYAEFYCLLFIDFKLQRVMLHRLGACALTQGLEWLMTYSKSSSVRSLGEGVGLRISRSSLGPLIS